MTVLVQFATGQRRNVPDGALTVSQLLWIEEVSVIESSAVAAHKKHELRMARWSLWRLPLASLAVLLLDAAWVRYGWWPSTLRAIRAEFDVVLAVGLVSLFFMAVLGGRALDTRSRWMQHRYTSADKLPDCAAYLVPKVRRALKGRNAVLWIDELRQDRVLDPGLYVVVDGERYDLRWWDEDDSPLDLATVDLFPELDTA